MINRKRFRTFSVMVDFCRNAFVTVTTSHASLLVIMLSGLCLSASTLAQTQLGGDIEGEAAGDRLGEVSISSDGYRLAVGALWNDGNGSDSGHARVFQWSDTAWVQLGTDIDGERANDQSGRSVSLSADGNRLAVGATGTATNQTHPGQVRVYQWSGSDWEQLGADLDGEVAGDRFGYSTSLSSHGNRLAVGAYGSDRNGDGSGHVRVYDWSGSAWTQLGSDIIGEAAGDYFGYSVSISSTGSRLAIGAYRNDGNGENSGHLRVYQWSGTAWTQMGADIDGEAAGDYSGAVSSLSADGTHVAIGAYSNGDNPVSQGSAASWAQPNPHNEKKDSGHVRIYQWSGADWVQLGADIDGEAEGDHSGVSVSLSFDGHRVAIGASSNDDNGNGAGHARVYQWSGTAWIQIGIDIDGEAAGDRSANVSLSSDGNRLAIGANRNDSSGEDAGHVRVFDLSMLNTLRINPGLNDAWYNPETDGQGFFITVFPDLGAVSLAWFTYDTELPPEDAMANLGDPGHRWLTAVGPIVDNQALLEIEMTSGGIFDTATEITRTDPPGSDGTIILTFHNCNSATIEYDIPSINQQGIVPIRRVADDNIVICEALNVE